MNAGQIAVSTYLAKAREAAVAFGLPREVIAAIDHAHLTIEEEAQGDGIGDALEATISMMNAATIEQAEIQARYAAESG